MKKLKSVIVGSILMLLSMPLFAQESSEIETIKKEIQTLYKSLKVAEYQDVLPYTVKGKTGFVNAKTKKSILIPTANFKEVTLAQPNIIGIYKDVYNYTFDTKTFDVKIESRFVMPEVARAPYEAPVDVIDSKDGYKGFKVDDNGELLAYSDLYNTQGNVRPFKFKGKYYAIATKKTGDDEYFDGIIDTEGNALSQFNFNVKCISLIEEVEDDIWFTIGLCRGLKGSLVSFNGKVKFENELLSSLYTFSDCFLYNLNSDDEGNMSGIFDIDTLDWTIKPQSAIKIGMLSYTSFEELDRDKIHDRSKAKMYFLVKEKDKTYYMDFALTKYLP